MRYHLRLVALLVTMMSLALMAVPADAQQARRVAPVRGQQARLVLTEVLRIGSAFGGNDEFGRIADVKFGRGGRIYVVDDLKHQVSVFDSTGRFIRRAGKQGSGPGEFQQPWDIAIDSRDSVFVWDWRQARFSVLSPDLRFVRSFGAPDRWLINGFEVLPDGTLLIAAYSPNAQGTIHQLSRTGRVMRSFGPRPNRGTVPDMAVRSVLGGFVDLSGSTLAYTSKSPYEVHFLGLDGRVRARCTGDPRWTSRPESVVTTTGTNTSLNWPAYVHSSRILDLGGGTYLNVISDLGRKRQTLDLLRSDCTLLERRTVDRFVTFADRRGNRLVAYLEEDDYPQVVVYGYRVQR